MTDIKELFDMVTNETRADRNVWNEQELRQRRSTRNRKGGALLLVAAVIVALGAFVAVSVQDRKEETPAGRGTVKVPPTALPRGAQDATIVMLDGTPVARIPGLPTGAVEFDLSPDGTTLAFVIAHGPYARIATMGVDGTGLRMLTRTDAIAEDPAWSPDGSKIAFTRTVEGSPPQIYVMDADGGNATLAAGSPTSESKARWSPDGNTIVYVNLGTTKEADQQYVKTADIWAVPAAGGAPVQLTHEAGADLYPDISPDGTQIVYRHDRRLMIMNVDGSDQRALLLHGAYFTPRWSPDGSRIAYGIWSGKYMSVKLGGTASKQALLLLHVLDPRTGTTDPVGDTGYIYDWNSPLWWSDDAILIHRIGH